MTEKIAVTPSAMSVQTKKAPLDSAIRAPIMWTTGTNDARSDPTIRCDAERDPDNPTQILCGIWSGIAGDIDFESWRR